MHILLLYATYSGSTMTASQVLSDALTELGHTVDMQLVSEFDKSLISSAQALILASPSWDYNGKQGMPHEDFESCVSQCSEQVKLDGKPFAVMGLGDSNYTHFCGAVTHLKKFAEDMGGKMIVDPLKIDQFYIDEETHTQSIKDWASNIAAALDKQ